MHFRFQQQQAVRQLESGGEEMGQKSYSADYPTPTAFRVEMLK
jgi:hypothetical protein